MNLSPEVTDLHLLTKNVQLYKHFCGMLKAEPLSRARITYLWNGIRVHFLDGNRLGMLRGYRRRSSLVALGPLWEECSKYDILAWLDAYGYGWIDSEKMHDFGE